MNPTVNLVKGAGFGFIILGTLVYNRLIFKKYFADKTKKDDESLTNDSLLSEKNYK